MSMCRFWFYLLPIIWLLYWSKYMSLMWRAAAERRRRGIAIAAFIGLMAYSVVLFITQQNTNLPRVGVGAFLLFASLLTLTWRMIFIRLYKTTGQRRRILMIGAGKAGQTLAELYQSLGTRSFNIIGFIDDDRQKVKKNFHGLPVLGSSGHIC